MKGTLLFNALREAIDEEMDRDPLVCVMVRTLDNMAALIKLQKICMKNMESSES